MRRKAARMGLMLQKSPRKDVNALDHGLFAVIDPRTNTLVSPSLHEQFAHGWTLEDVEDYFAGDETPVKKKAKKTPARKATRR